MSSTTHCFLLAGFFDEDDLFPEAATARGDSGEVGEEGAVVVALAVVTGVIGRVKDDDDRRGRVKVVLLNAGAATTAVATAVTVAVAVTVASRREDRGAEIPRVEGVFLVPILILARAVVLAVVLELLLLPLWVLLEGRRWTTWCSRRLSERLKVLPHT